ncbi:hypothetical protein [Trinickia mobilis]|nr:hypothetical protein [Trinickia mobilis]
MRHLRSLSTLLMTIVLGLGSLSVAACSTPDGSMQSTSSSSGGGGY